MGPQQVLEWAEEKVVPAIAPDLAVTDPTTATPPFDTTTLGQYERFVLFFSGGKDSLALLLHMLELGVPREKIELHHHLVDGEPGKGHLMDWPITSAYCRAVAQHFGLAYKESWREGGFNGEMERQDSPTGAVAIPLHEGGHKVVGGDGPPGTRLKFPQVAASLSVRWCSSALKIDVGARYLTNDERFQTGKTLVLTGERAQESKARANYAVFERHRSDNRDGKRVIRFIDHWRGVHAWTEHQVWEIIERWKVTPHPAYMLGWGRCSCLLCIFGNKDTWASAKEIAPSQFYEVASREKRYGVTINRKYTVIELAQMGKSHVPPDSPWKAVAMGTEWALPMVTDNWTLPSGAFREGGGPT